MARLPRVRIAVSANASLTGPGSPTVRVGSTPGAMRLPKLYAMSRLKSPAARVGVCTGSTPRCGDACAGAKATNDAITARAIVDAARANRRLGCSGRAGRGRCGCGRLVALNAAIVSLLPWTGWVRSTAAASSVPAERA
ncbi:Uncharacterised protein [Mycobacteroides abscessus subsp. abscessus]|nr:Uncharacterised protein [Mycobacteroides abscessus subsp. abscessus]